MILHGKPAPPQYFVIIYRYRYTEHTNMLAICWRKNPTPITQVRADKKFNSAKSYGIPNVNNRLSYLEVYAHCPVISYVPYLVPTWYIFTFTKTNLKIMLNLNELLNTVQ